MQDVAVATWVYCEDEGVDGMYPQVGGDPTSSKFHEVYWRCAAVSMLSAVAAIPEARLVLYTNVATLPTVDGIDLQAAMQSMGVTVRTVALSRRLEGHDTPWRNQFYVFDALEDIGRDVGDRGVIVVLDGDCVWTRDGHSLFQDVVRHGAVTYRIDYPESAAVNGISLDVALPLRGGLGLATSQEEPGYYGGELIAVTGAVARQVLDLFNRAWEANLERQRMGQPYLTEEAHMLSAIYDHLGLGADFGSRYIKRMWTSLRCRTVEGSDPDLLLWHLPAEKEYAFREVFSAAARRGLFDASSIGSGEVTELITGMLRRSWEPGPTRMRHNARRLMTAVRRRVR